MPKIVVKNKSQALQGVMTKSGTVMLEPGEARELEVHENDVDHYSHHPAYIVGGEPTKPSTAPRVGDAAPDGGDTGALFQQIEDLENQITELQGQRDYATDQLTVAAARVSEHESTIASLTTERDDLAARVKQFENERDGVKTGLVAKHKGGGSYSIFDAQDNEVMSKLTKEQTDEFNGLPDDAAKTKWLADNTAKE